MATLGFLEISFFLDKCYDVISSVHDVTNRILSRDSNYIQDVVMWPKFDNYSTSMRDDIITSIRIWPDKTTFLRDGLDLSSMIWDWHYEWPWSFTPV